MGGWLSSSPLTAPGELAALGRSKANLASWPPQRRPGELAALGRAGRLKEGLASWPPPGDPAA